MNADRPEQNPIASNLFSEEEKMEMDILKAKISRAHKPLTATEIARLKQEAQSSGKAFLDYKKEQETEETT